MAHPKLRPPIIWETHEYLYQEKTTDWYWGVGVLGITLAILAIIFGNALLAVLIIVGGITLCLFGAQRPKHVRFEVNHSGLMIDRTLYPYKTLQSFWVEDNRHHGIHSKVFFQSRRMVTPIIVILLEDVEPEHLRDFLLDHLPESEHTDSFSQKLLEYFGF